MHCWWEYIKWWVYWGKQYSGSSIHYTQNYHVIQQFHFWVNKSKELKARIQAGNYTPIFIAELYTAAKRQEQPKYVPKDEWNIIQLSKGREIWHTLQYRWTLRAWERLTQLGTKQQIPSEGHGERGEEGGRSLVHQAAASGHNAQWWWLPKNGNELTCTKPHM